ncbi:MAG: ABC transporter permease [Mucilaginibacter polytrichastri]|nr:ABC transporter permease [Mucilaginibacter polytrichastri]
MLKNYLQTAWRNISKTIGYSLLNIAGLAIGMAVALVIGLWVYDQYAYDKFLPEHQSVYRVQRNFFSNGDTLTFPTTSLKLADALRTQVPEIEYVAESDWTSKHGLKVGDKKLYITGAQSGADIFRILQYPFIEGNRNTAFNDAYSIVLTESLARSLFGTENAMNKMVRYDNAHDLKVTGIIRDVPANATFSFQYIVPTSYIYSVNPATKADGLRSFGNNNLQIFVKLKPGISYGQVAQKIRTIEHSEKGSNNAMNSYVTLQPMTRWHLYSNYVNGQDTAGFLDYVKMFSLVGLLVLIIACINFINLTTARSEKRAKEVGIRKAIGSQRKDLIIQFLLEAFLLTAIAFVFAVLLAWLTLPAFNTLTDSRISIPFGNLYFWAMMTGCLLLTALLAGSRPAFYLSSFNAVKVLKGTVQAGKSSLSRKVLVVIQFSCSIALVISTVIIYQQIQHAKSRPTGYSLNRLLSSFINDDLYRNYTALKNELVAKGIVTSMTTATSPATDVWWHSDVEYWPGKNPGENVEMGTIKVSGDYFTTVGMRMTAGRDFFGVYDSTSVIFNETAIKRLRLKDPVGQRINWQGRDYIIAGVVKDALMISPFKSADPTMFLCSPDPQTNLIYRLSPNLETREAIARLTTIFNTYAPAYPYDHSFSDENYAAKFRLEMLIGKLAAIFAGLAIFISCLGLLGLAAYVAEQRTKEIGIRKVLGASVQQVWLLLSKDFIVLVLISCLIATPISFYFLHNWLMNYDYRITIGAGVFLSGAVLALVITIVTISIQSVKAALMNPVKSLRSE